MREMIRTLQTDVHKLDQPEHTQRLINVFTRCYLAMSHTYQSRVVFACAFHHLKYPGLKLQNNREILAATQHLIMWIRLGAVSQSGLEYADKILGKRWNCLQYRK